MNTPITSFFGSIQKNVLKAPPQEFVLVHRRVLLRVLAGLGEHAEPVTHEVAGET